MFYVGKIGVERSMGKKETSYEWMIPELEVDVQQRIPTEDPTNLFGFGCFIIFIWRF
jgi:hypothetical protein